MSEAPVDLAWGEVGSERTRGCVVVPDAWSRPWREGDHAAVRPPIPKRPAPLLNDVELLALPDPAWLIEGLLAEQGQAMLAGAPGVGKTTLAVAAACSVATPRPFCGRRVRAHGPVIYCALEGTSAVRSRIRSWKTASDVPLDRVIGVHIWTGTLAISEADDLAWFMDAARPIAPVLVVIDTMARAAVGLEENSSTEMGRVVAGMDRMRDELGCAVILLHHTDKKGQAERGSSAIRGAIDAVWLLTEADDVLTLECSKDRNSEPFAPMDLRRARTDDGGVVLKSALDVAPTGETSPKQQLVIDALSSVFSADGATIRELMEALPSVSKATIHRVLKTLTDTGKVRHAASHYQLVGGGL